MSGFKYPKVTAKIPKTKVKFNGRLLILGCGGVSQCQTKSDHTTNGCLWATALFTSGDVTVSAGDQLKVTYTVSA